MVHREPPSARGDADAGHLLAHSPAGALERGGLAHWHEEGQLVVLASSERQIQVCSDVYRGVVAANGPCLADADCVSGLICDKGYCGTATMVAQGAGCANIGDTCPQGFTCNNTTGPWICAVKAGLGGACSDTQPCLETFRCAAGACSVQLGIGADCAVDQDCSSNFCEPYAAMCATDVRFANGSAACTAMAGP